MAVQRLALSSTAPTGHIRLLVHFRRRYNSGQVKFLRMILGPPFGQMH